MERAVFFVSDRTGITVESLGNSLLSQFDNIVFKKQTFRFVDTLDKARVICDEIRRIVAESRARPIIFSTLIDSDVRNLVAGCGGIFFDFVDTFIVPLETEFQSHSTHTVGRAHGLGDALKYNLRMGAVNFALATDDGLSTRDYGQSDVIVLGVSRSGKTPTCLYLALTFGVYASNFPFTEEDLEDLRLPPALTRHRAKLYGLSIEPARLQQIRRERKADGHYASLKQCLYEVRQVEALYRKEGIPFLVTTTMSVEEIAATILHEQRLQWRLG